jgi:hypothetical protein
MPKTLMKDNVKNPKPSEDPDGQQGAALQSMFRAAIEHAERF